MRLGYSSVVENLSRVCETIITHKIISDGYMDCRDSGRFHWGGMSFRNLLQRATTDINILCSLKLFKMGIKMFSLQNDNYVNQSIC